MGNRWKQSGRAASGCSLVFSATPNRPVRSGSSRHRASADAARHSGGARHGPDAVGNRTRPEPGAVLAGRPGARNLGLVAAQLPHQPPKTEVADLYDFGDGSRLEAIRAHGGEAPFLMIVGHNPALQQLAVRLAGEGNSA